MSVCAAAALRCLLHDALTDNMSLVNLLKIILQHEPTTTTSLLTTTN